MEIPWQDWLQSALFWLARVALALLLLWVGSRYARKAREWVKRMMENPHMPVTISHSIVRIASEIAFLALWVVLVAAALVLIGVPLQTVLIAVVILLAIVAYALRESLANLAATVIFILFQPFRRGESIETMGFSGTVYDIEVFNTVLLAADQRLITLPNAKIQEEGVINYSRMTTARITVEFVVAYGEDTAKVTEIVLGVMARDPLILPDPPPAVTVIELSVTGVRMGAQATVAASERGNEPAELRAAIIAQLVAQGIRFPTTIVATPAASRT